ncbi:MAG: aminotransferase class I/II-fold pyridoxal phosphate-dependent enzyme [Bacteroidia bacterium]|nr:aminotransferase class I/II-fold pyridoxal phosphate-dependent enzyme [Bacteroidia bacterium]
MAESLIGSEIIKLANEVNELIRRGEKIYNFTIGDFDPAVFPIPHLLTDLIIKAYKDEQTNYPAANGMPVLRTAVSHFVSRTKQLDYLPEEVLITSGSRPAIYATFKTLLDPEDVVIYPSPSWNNNHYCHLSLAKGVMIETQPEQFFMPDASLLEPHLKNARMIAFCSPLNPTGTVFSKKQLESICDLVLQENERRKGTEKPLYVMYDQVYSSLLFEGTKHYNPVSLRSAMRDYTIFINGISKSFAATGVRVGWAYGPKYIINRMAAILSHVGAWAPKAEQIAVASFLENTKSVDTYLEQFKDEIYKRLKAFHDAFVNLKLKGYNVDCIAPQGAIYLTVKFDLTGKKTAEGKTLQNQGEVTSYLLKKATLAVVPFSAFGASQNSPWYRISVGTCTGENQIKEVMVKLEAALSELS